MPELNTNSLHELKQAVMNMPQYQPVTDHIFHGGMYCRQVFREAGTLIVGKVHKKEHFYMVVTGTILITTEDGAIEAHAPYLFCSKPGTQRNVYAVTDALCMTIHRTDNSTVEDVEDEVVEYDPNCKFLTGNTL